MSRLTDEEILEWINQLGYDRPRLAALKPTLPAGIPLTEVHRFLYWCNERGLSPLLGQAVCTERRSGAGVTYQFAETVDGYRAKAEETGRYAPGKPTTYEYNQDGTLLSATASIRVWHPESQTWLDVSETAYYDEFVQTFYNDKTGKIEATPTWKRMGRVMLSGNAEKRALRRAFPKIFGGAYSEFEYATGAADAVLEEGQRRGGKRALPRSEQSQQIVRGALEMMNSRKPAEKVDTQTGEIFNPEGESGERQNETTA